MNNELKTAIGASTHTWGVEVRQVEIRDISCPPSYCGPWPAKPKPSGSDGPRSSPPAASSRPVRSWPKAAAKLYESPGAMQLRTLQTLAEVASEHNSTLVFPLPIEILAGFVNGTIGMSSPGDGTAAPGGGPKSVPLSTVMPAPSVIGGSSGAGGGVRAGAVGETGAGPTPNGSVEPGVNDVADDPAGARVDDPAEPGADGVSQSA